MSQTTRRRFIRSGTLAGMGSVILSSSSKTDFSDLDEALLEPVLRREYFPDPVFIDSCELLEYSGNYMITCETSTLVPDDGILQLPGGIGSGVEIDPDFIAKHRILTI